MILLQDEDRIYFKKTRDYFREVLSDYSNGNYRSAVVMLYSVTICDLLLKLQELNEVYNDGIASSILKDVNKERINPSGKSKSSWEKQLIDRIYNETKMLDLQAYTEINHLYDHRNFSAHPALNENYELIIPSRDITIAHITSILNNVLIKPPVFAKNIVSFLSDDIAAKKDIYWGEKEKFKEYLHNKSFVKMTDAMKVNVFKAFWKFCFCKPDNPQCMENIRVNLYVLEMIMDDYQGILDYIDNDEVFKSIANNRECCYYFSLFVSMYPYLYEHLSNEIKLCIVPSEEDHDLRAFAWYKASDKKEHIQNLINDEVFNLEDEKVIEYLGKSYREEGLACLYVDYCIAAYAKSWSFNTADFRFAKLIYPNLELFDKEQFIRLIEACDSNDQLYNRWGAMNANNSIVKAAKDVLGDDYDYAQYKNFKFNEELKL